MMHYRKAGTILLMLFVLGSVFLVNLRGMIQGYYGFYHTREAASRNPVFQKLAFVEEYRPYSLFLSYTGLETGYGFFAPNVASDFIVEMSTADSAGRVIKRETVPLVTTREGFLRMNTACSMFMYYARPDSTSLDGDRCRIFLKGLCLRTLEQQPRAATATARVYLYHHPFLKDYAANQAANPSYILYESQSYNNSQLGAW